MEGIAAASRSIEAVNQMMKAAIGQSAEMAEKLVKVQVESMVASGGAGTGGQIDLTA